MELMVRFSKIGETKDQNIVDDVCRHTNGRCSISISSTILFGT
jgi:hypothetical protein